MEISAHGNFGPWKFCNMEISEHGHFGTWIFWNMEISERALWIALRSSFSVLLVCLLLKKILTFRKLSELISEHGNFNIHISEYGNFGTWKFRSMEISEHGNFGTWIFGNMEIFQMHTLTNLTDISGNSNNYCTRMIQPNSL